MKSPDKMNKPAAIKYYRDIPCIWVTQCRLEELTWEMDQPIELREHYVDVFGETFLEIANRNGKKRAAFMSLLARWRMSQRIIKTLYQYQGEVCWC